MKYRSGSALVIPTEVGDPLEFVSAFTPASFGAPVSRPHMVLEYGNELLVPDIVSVVIMTG